MKLELLRLLATALLDEVVRISQRAADAQEAGERADVAMHLLVLSGAVQAGCEAIYAHIYTGPEGSLAPEFSGADYSRVAVYGDVGVAVGWGAETRIEPGMHAPRVSLHAVAKVFREWQESFRSGPRSAGEVLLLVKALGASGVHIKSLADAAVEEALG